MVTNTVTGLVTRFTYDGNGNRVKVTSGVTTTVYVGAHYEVQGATVTKYYYLGGQRIAMRVQGDPDPAKNGIFYLHADHPSLRSGQALGSASLTTNQSGAVVAQQRYYPYGEVRWSSGTMPTDRTFTGQQILPSTGGLMYYGARFYSPAIGRFLSADTIVPSPGNPQDWNRYAYARNDPLKYTDPSGHWTEEQLEEYLGENWRDTYFGQEGAFEGREELLEFLLSDNTTSECVLDLVRTVFHAGAAMHGILDDEEFHSLDAIGLRLSITGGPVGAAGGFSVDAILNLAAGQMSIFGSPEGGLQLGAGVSGVEGVVLLRGMPSNDDYRGAFRTLGIAAGAGLGGNVEYFKGLDPEGALYHCPAPTSGYTEGWFIGAGGVVGLGGYYTHSYSFELYRVDAQGGHLAPHPPSFREVVTDIGKGFLELLHRTDCNAH